MRRRFDREAVVRMAMKQAESYFRDGRAGGTQAVGALKGVRACLFFMDADDEAAKVGEMMQELMTPPVGKKADEERR